MHLVYYFAALVVLPALSSSVDDGLRAVLFGGVRAGKPEHTKLCVDFELLFSILPHFDNALRWNLITG